MTADFDILTFDCYGTLIDWRGGISDAFSRIGAAAGRSVDRDQVLDLHARFEPEVQREEFRSYAKVLDLTATRIADALGLEIPTDDRHFLSASLANWQPFADTGAALERLREAGYRLGILSNVDDDLSGGDTAALPRGLRSSDQRSAGRLVQTGPGAFSGSPAADRRRTLASCSPEFLP